MADLNAFKVVGDSVAPYAYIGGVGRFFGTIFADVTLEERHDDEMAITDHPVETGASISDHCFVQPSRLELRIGFSDSTGQSEGYSKQQYAEIIALRDKREPFDVSTGKRQYKNMLINSIQIITNGESENALQAIIRLREVIRVSTQSTSGSNTDSANQKDPQSTSDTSHVGTTQVDGQSSGIPTFADPTKPAGTPGQTGIDAFNVSSYNNNPAYNNYIGANGVGVFPGAGGLGNGTLTTPGGTTFPTGANPWGT